MQSSIQRVVSDGTLEFIDLAIEYIDKVNVKVSVDDVPIGAPGSGTPYTYEWITAVRIKITPVVPLAGIVTLRRVTPTLKMYHVYDDGATFNDFTMDENFKQLLFIGQEAIDGGVATDFYSDINIHGYRIKASADGIEPTDLVTVRQYRDDANGAFVSRTAAEAAAAAALVSQNTAATAATAAGNSQTAAAASAAAALFSQNAAASSEGAASTSANNAQASATAAAASYDSFDDRYLGAKTSNPTLDNDSNALLEGALYWNTVAKEMRVYNGTAWAVAYLPADGYLEKSQNLADLVNASTARSNLGLGTSATKDVGTAAGDVAAGDDARILGALPAANVKQVTGTSTTDVISQKASTDIFGQPDITGSCTTNGTTNNTLALTGIVTTLALEVGDVIRIQYSGYNKLHTVESITNDNTIIVNYEHAGNRGNGSLKLADQTATITVTRIAKWYNAPIGLGQARVNLASVRAKGTNFTNPSGRPVMVEVVTNMLASDISIEFTIDGLIVDTHIRGGAFNTLQTLSGIVPKGSEYRANLGVFTIGLWSEWR